MNKVSYLATAITIAAVMVTLPVVVPIIAKKASADSANTYGEYR